MRPLSLVVISALAFGAAACSSSGIDLPTSPSASAAAPAPIAEPPPSSPAPPGDPAPPAPSPVDPPPPSSQPPSVHTFSGIVPANGETSHVVTTARDGRATFTLAWTSASVDLDLSLTAAACSDFLPQNCQLFEITANTAGNSEVITRQVKAGEAYRAWAINIDRVNAHGYTLDVRIQ